MKKKKQKKQKCDKCKGVGLIKYNVGCTNCLKQNILKSCYKCENSKKNGNYIECPLCFGKGVF